MFPLLRDPFPLNSGALAVSRSSPARLPFQWKSGCSPLLHGHALEGEPPVMSFELETLLLSFYPFDHVAALLHDETMEQSHYHTDVVPIWVYVAADLGEEPFHLGLWIWFADPKGALADSRRTGDSQSKCALVSTMRCVSSSFDLDCIGVHFHKWSFVHYLAVHDPVNIALAHKLVTRTVTPS